MLTSLARAAKQYWGYSLAQMDAWAEELRISSQSIATEPTFVAVSGGRLVGVLQLSTAASPWEVECLWVDPAFIRRGLGTRLMHEAAALARNNGQTQLAIDADPNAEAFYLRIGADRVGSLRAPIPGSPQRVRPQLRLDIGPAA